MIYVNAQGGLCNRLRVINSGIRLAAECNIPLCVYWICGYDMNASFSQLFRSSKRFSISDISEKSLKTRLLFSRWNPFHYNASESSIFVQKCRCNAKLPKIISTYYDFYHNGDYSWLRPLDPIQRKIEQGKELSEGSIGVHIRRTDNVHCMRYSPVELFVKRMEQTIDHNKDVRFFVCSDDDQVKCDLTKRFGCHIATRDKIASRRERTGVMDAVIDFCFPNARGFGEVIRRRFRMLHLK